MDNGGMTHETQIKWDALGITLSPNHMAVRRAVAQYNETQLIATQTLGAEMFLVAIRQAKENQK